jgi:hypothetical protein
MEHVTLEWEFRSLGDVRLDDGGLRFPKVSAKPGVYRFTFRATNAMTHVYIGEAEQLGRRFQHYRTPGPTQPTNLRLNQLSTQVLSQGGSLSVEILTEAHLIDDNGGRTEVDLAWKPGRVMVEAAALLTARAANWRLLNL